MAFTLEVGFVKETCCNCGIVFAIEQSHYNNLRSKRESGSFYCPNGHGQHYTGKSDEQIIADLKWTVQHRDNLLNEKRIEIERMKECIGKGVCLYCKRTFGNLAKHMQCKHPKK